MASKILGIDTASLGSWIEHGRGRDGYIIANDASAVSGSTYPLIPAVIPSYLDTVDIQPSGRNYAFVNTLDSSATRFEQAVEIPSTSLRRSSTAWQWGTPATSATITITPNDEEWHMASLFFYEGSASGSRNQRVDVGGESSPTIFAASQTPPWLRIAYSGETTFQIVRQGGAGIWLTAIMFAPLITSYAGGGHDGIVGSYVL